MRHRALPAIALTAVLLFGAPALESSAAPIVTSPLATLPTTSYPVALVVDGSGYSYSANSGPSTISRVAPDGTVDAAFATLPTGAGLRDMAMDSTGTMYTANSLLGTLSRVLPDGSVTGVYASFGAGATPVSIEVAPDNSMFIANYGTDQISKISPAGTLTVAFATLPTGSHPVDVTLDSAGNIYTLNFNLTISKITPGGAVTPVFATLPAGTSLGNAVVDSTGRIYVSDTAHPAILEFDNAGGFVRTIAITSTPRDIVLDRADNLFIALYSTNTVAMLTSSGDYVPSLAPLLATDYANLVVTTDHVVYVLGYAQSTLSRIELEATITTSIPTPTGIVGSPYKYQVAATGYEPVTYRTVGPTPPGVTIDGTTGILAGTPTMHGTFSFEIIAANRFGDSSPQPVTFTVVPSPAPTSPISSNTGQTGGGGMSTASTGSSSGSRESRELARTGTNFTASASLAGAALALIAGTAGVLAIRIGRRWLNSRHN